MGKASHAASDSTHVLPSYVLKRDSAIQAFDALRIERAIALCFMDINQIPKTRIQALTRRVISQLPELDTASVEQIQDTVEKVLMDAGESAAAKHYILYRAEHAAERDIRPVPQEVTDAFALSANYFPTQLQQFQFTSKYARFDGEKGRRETWIETVDRSVDFLRELTAPHGELGSATWERLRRGILSMQAMPSMRLLAMAGPAARRQNLAIFNCSAMPVADLKAFGEALLISFSGCGVGFSVEREYVERFPRIQRQKGRAPLMHVIDDTTEGWQEAIDIGVAAWFAGEDVAFDYSQIRPVGAILKIKGGRASGSGPLQASLNAIRSIILKRQGAFLRSIDAHDIMCHVGTCAVSGGTRRTAMISLFDWDDDLMLRCKEGATLDQNQQRWNANNSAVWPEHFTQQDLMQQMLTMDVGQRGEPGIFNRAGLETMKPTRRKSARWLTNPCGEIALREWSLCNLSIAVARGHDTLETLREKVELATIIGTIQSLATHYPGLRDEWRKNGEEERLLGVDITGQMDCPAVRDADVLDALKAHAIETNRQYAEKLHINQSAAISCNKPSGNSSVLLDCSSGIHPRWARYYVRNVRVGAHEPMYKVLRNSGVPLSPENGQTEDNATTFVASFPVAAPDGAITRNDVSALQQLDHWLLNKTHWAEHTVSCTVTYRPEELLDITKWLWEHRQQVSGISFLPKDDAQYSLMPYQEITEAEYRERLAAFPSVDYSKLWRYEQSDMTTAAQEVACVAGNCEVDFITPNTQAS